MFVGLGCSWRREDSRNDQTSSTNTHFSEVHVNFFLLSVFQEGYCFFCTGVKLSQKAGMNRSRRLNLCDAHPLRSACQPFFLAKEDPHIFEGSLRAPVDSTAKFIMFIVLLG